MLNKNNKKPNNLKTVRFIDPLYKKRHILILVLVYKFYLCISIQNLSGSNLLRF